MAPAPELPTKKGKTLKLFSSNVVDKLSNPLNSSVSLNHKQGENLTTKGNFRAPGQAKRQGTKLSHR
jgi:hypothetical protein